jgi:rhamnosyltransferase subunit B
MSRFVLATLGTHGDLNPYVAVALGLQKRGHYVSVATCPSYRGRIESLGLRFHPLRPDLAEMMKSPETSARGNDLRHGTEYILKTLVLPRLRETYDDLTAACAGADLLVTHPVLLPAPLVAEKMGLRWISVILSPGIFLSAHDPPLLPPLSWFYPLRHLGPLPHRLLYRWIDRVTRQWMRPVDDLRQQVGLPPSAKNPVLDGMLSPFGTLAWFSPLIGPPQADWPRNRKVTGFVYSDGADDGATLYPPDHVLYPPDRELLDFLDRGDPPVVFTLGTSAVTVADDFYRVSLEVARRGGWRAVLLTGTDERNQISKAALPDSVFVTQYAPYSELFCRAAAVVHSGGIGTVAETLRAGVPMLIVPHHSDQPDNAARVKRLGCGRVIPRARYQATRAVNELRHLLGNPAYAARAHALADSIRREGGLAPACDALEEQAVGPFTAIPG